MAQTVKILPAMQETWVQSLGQEDPLEKGVAMHFSIFTWRISWTKEPAALQSMGSQRMGQDWATNTFFFNLCVCVCVRALSYFGHISFFATLQTVAHQG